MINLIYRLQKEGNSPARSDDNGAVLLTVVVGFFLYLSLLFDEVFRGAPSLDKRKAWDAHRSDLQCSILSWIFFNLSCVG